MFTNRITVFGIKLFWQYYFFYAACVLTHIGRNIRYSFFKYYFFDTASF